MTNIIRAEPDALAFRRAMGQFLTGVAVVTADGPNGPHGATVNSLTAVSVRPPMLLICLHSGARMARMVAEAGGFVVNVLAASHGDLAARFASADRHAGLGAFDDIPHVLGKSGAPAISGALATLECSMEREIEAGDHSIFLAHVVDLAHDAEPDPLTFHRGEIRPSV